MFYVHFNGHYDYLRLYYHYNFLFTYTLIVIKPSVNNGPSVFFLTYIFKWLKETRQKYYNTFKMFNLFLCHYYYTRIQALCTYGIFKYLTQFSFISINPFFIFLGSRKKKYCNISNIM